jgi:hypothetical protein
MTVFVPARMRALPSDAARRLPIPWFVATPPKGQAVDFRVADPAKRDIAIRRRRCWLCGQAIGPYRPMAYCLGVMCLANRCTSEPASHPDCAAYAVQACPFLSRPKMQRSPRPLPEGSLPAPGVGAERNPGVTVVFVTREMPRTFAIRTGGYLVRLPDEAERLEFWREGRESTFEEVMESLETGAPSLLTLGGLDGADGRREVEAELERTRYGIRAYFTAKQLADAVEAAS